MECSNNQSTQKACVCVILIIIVILIIYIIWVAYNNNNMNSCEERQQFKGEERQQMKGKFRKGKFTQPDASILEYGQMSSRGDPHLYEDCGMYF